MEIKRAVLCGALLWALIFFEVSILMFGFKLQPGFLYYAIHYIAAAILAAIVSLIYFSKARAGARKGLAAGIIFAVTGIILDSIITVPLFVKTYSFFLDPYLWIGIAEGAIVVTLMGALGIKKT